MTWKIDPFWEALAIRCEDCDYRDRELDSEIDVALHGGEIEWRMANYTMESYPCRKYVSPDHIGGFGFAPIPQYTSSMDAAYGTVPEYGTPDIWHIIIYNRGYKNGVYLDGKAMAIIHSPLSSGGGPYFEGVAHNIAQAISAAGLRSHGYMIALAKEIPEHRGVAPMSPPSDQVFEMRRKDTEARLQRDPKIKK